MRQKRIFRKQAAMLAAAAVLAFCRTPAVAQEIVGVEGGAQTARGTKDPAALQDSLARAGSDLSPQEEQGGTSGVSGQSAGEPSLGTASAGMPSENISSAGTTSAGTLSTDTSSAGIPSAGTPSTDMPSAGTPSTDMSSAGTTSADMPSTGTTSADMPSTDTSFAGTPSTDMSSADTPPAQGETAETECLVLADANEDTEVFIYAPQGSSFPKDAVFRVLTVADIARETEDPNERQQRAEELEKTLKEAWRGILKKYIPWAQEQDGDEGQEFSRIRAFLPYYILMTDADGNEVSLPEKTELHVLIRDRTFLEDVKNRQDLYLVAWQGKGNEFCEAEDKRMLLDDEEETVQICFTADHLGWISIVQLDMDAPDPFQTEETQTDAADTNQPGEDWVGEGQTEGAQPGEEWTGEGQTGGAQPGEEWTGEGQTEGAQPGEEWTGEEQTEGGQPGEDWTWEGQPGEDQAEEGQPGENWTGEGQTEEGQPGEDWTGEDLTEEDLTEEQTETETEIETETETETESETETGVPWMLAALAPTGVNVTDPSSGFVKMTPDQLDGSFRSAKWYRGITTCTKFNNAGSSVTEFSYGERYFFYPKDDSAKGKFGAVWNKILYADGQWYDMKMTVIDYTNYTYAGASGQKVASHPMIGFGYAGCHWDFKETLGEYVMKIEFIKNGDSSQTPVRLNTRFQWWDIDNNQRFGIRTGDGSISQKYYQVDQSNVRCRMEAPEVDPGNTYLFLTADGDGTMDKAGNVGFALAGCSTYYVAVGFRDHIRESSEYRYSEENVQNWNQSLANGGIPNPSVNAPGNLGQTDLDVLIPPDDAYPIKYVSNDGSSWHSYNYLPTPASEYYYRIRQYIPWQTSTNYYTACMIRDTLPRGVEYVGEAKVVCVEDGRNVTSYFIIRDNQGTVAAAPNASLIKNALFYGQTYDFVFKVRMNPAKLEAEYSGDTATYQAQNKSSVEFTYQGGGSYTNTSNTVTTKAFSNRTEQDAPIKRLDGNESLTAKDLASPKEAITFSVYQTVPASDAAWKISKVEMTDTLEGCLEFLSAKVYEKSGEAYQACEGWTVGASGQTVTAVREFSPGGTVFRFDIQCRIREEYDMSAYSRVDKNRQSYVIPNTAEVELTWSRGSGSPQTVKKKTNEVYVRCNAGPLSVRLLLTKEIDAADIVWAHGNPTFTFCVTGEDVDGENHTYYEMVEFTPEDAQDGAKLSKTVELELPAGWYTATEEKTMRYTLDSIHSVKGGSVTGKTAVFDLSASGEGCATFYNKKTTDEGLTDSALAENVIGE